MFRRTLHILYVLLVSGFWIPDSCAYSQNVFSSEEDLKKQANKLFEEEDFAKAYPLFSQLLSLYPKDPQYNYKFGTCLLFSSNDKEKAIPYLEFAAKRQKQGVDKEVFFYLGKAYHLNYRFADGIKNYNTYKGISSSKQVEKYTVDRQVEMCENGKHLLKNITELSVLEKKEVPVSDFFRSYNLSEFNAKLIICPEDLKTLYDKKKKEDNLMYLAPDRNEIYYCSYGEDGKNGKDIYYVKRTPSGELSKPVRMSDVINTKYDEDYAFLHPNGKTFYFCSKGHNSMGGYDIFKSEWDKGTQSWSSPVNMDFAINTPDDDILFISDSEDKNAYFSSRRENGDGNITVYKIKLDRKPLDLAIIAGTLTKNIGDKMAKATITVTKVPRESDPSGKDEVAGVFNTNAADGSYTLQLPNGGKFLFMVESAGFKKSSEFIVIPTQREIKPLKQEILLVNENGQDKVIVKNNFDAQVDSADLALSIQYIKSKALLEVNTDDDAVVMEENTAAASTETKAETKNSIPVTNADIIEMAYQDAKETQQEANEMRKNSDAARKLATQKNDLSVQQYQEAQDLMKKAETITNRDEKTALMDKSAILRKKSETLSAESALALTLSSQMDELANEKQQHADVEMKYAKNLDNAIKTNASEKKMNELLAQKEELDKKSEILSAPFPPDMHKQAQEKQNEVSKIKTKQSDILQEAEYLQSESKHLRIEAEKAKNNTLGQNMILQAEEMEKEAETKKKEAETYNVRATQLQSQADSLKNNASLTASIMKEILPASTGTEQTAQEAAAKSSVSSITPQPAALNSPYVDVFVNKMYEAEKKPNELEREETLAVIYQSWTDSLDNQISSLKKSLASTTQEEKKTKIQNKIYELQSSVDEKRQKAADSRNNVDNLKLQEALAIASDISSEPTTAATPEALKTTTSDTQGTETLIETKNINDYFESKLKNNEKITNEYEKKVKEQELYNDWSASLYNESLRLKKDGRSGKADDALNESKTKQALAIQSAGQVTQIKAEHPEWVASANLTSDETNSPAETSEAKTQSTTELVKPSTITVSAEMGTETTSSGAEPASNAIPDQSAAQPVENMTISMSEQVESTPASSMPASVKNKDEYTHYVALRNESDWSKKNADRQYKQADDVQKTADEQFRESQKIAQKIENTFDPDERKKLQEQSKEIDLLYLKNQAKADSIKQIARNTEAEANSKRTESELYLQSLDQAVYEEIVSAAGYKTGAEPAAGNTARTESDDQPENTTSTEVTKEIKEKTTPSSTTPVITNPVSLTTNSTAKTKTESSPDLLLTDSLIQKETEKQESGETGKRLNTELLKYYDALFDKIEFSGAAYSASKPIPVNAPMPEGLIFKVQIGAFKNPIPQNLFKGIKPITAETTPQGFKRYTAGLFQKFSAASNAKNQVNDLGYRDAFVVAFFNGKRIPLNEALAKAKEAGENTTSAAAGSGSEVNSSTNVANSTDVKAVSGLFYAIQIGVFSKPVTSPQLYNISPLNSEKTDNGLIRYTTGRFDDETKASRTKNNIADKGISDAFVVAYFDGKRISLTTAKTMIDSQGKEILAKDRQEYSFIPSDTTTSESAAQSLNTSLNLELVFKVQVGAYREQVPIDIANILLANSDKGIKTFTDDNGLILYTVGEFLEYESANNMKTQLINNGISGAFVIAFKGGKKMSAADALELIKNR